MVNCYVLIRVLLVSLSGFAFGYDVGSVNGVKDMEGYRLTLNLSYQLSTSLDGSNSTHMSCDTEDDLETSAILGLILSLLAVGSLIGALMSGFLSDFAGRKPAVIIGGSLVAIGGLLHAGAVQLWMVLLSRLFAGIGIGCQLSRYEWDTHDITCPVPVPPDRDFHQWFVPVADQGCVEAVQIKLHQLLCPNIRISTMNSCPYDEFSKVTPLYVGEISPEGSRGKMLSFLNINGGLGYLAGTVVNVIVKDYLFGWRISVGIQFLVGAVLALGTLFLPRSPRWLMKKEREVQALAILTQVYKSKDRAQSQVEVIRTSVADSSNEHFFESLKYIFQWKIIQRVLLGFSLLLLGRFTGGIFIAGFSVTIFCGIGLPGFVVSLSIALSNIAAMFLSLGIIDKLGRKPVFLIGLSAMFFSHIFSASLIFSFDLEDSAADVLTASQEAAAYLIMVSMCVFIAGFNISCGSVPWIIVGEIFPLKGRGIMISICNTGFWIGLISVNQISPVLLETALRISGTLLVFSGIILLYLLYVLLLLPETKGLTLEEMEELFSKPWLKRTNVFYYLKCVCFLELFSGKAVKKKDCNNIDHNSTDLTSDDSLDSKPEHSEIYIFTVVSYQETQSASDKGCKCMELQSVNWYVWTRVIFMSIGGFTYGYDLGSINGVKDMEGYRKTLNLSFIPVASSDNDAGNGSFQSCNLQDDVETSAILGLIVSLLFVGCLIGALVAGFISDLAGRKPAIIVGASLVSIGGLMHTATFNLWMVLPSRIIIGIGVGILYQVTPLYVAEISPENSRGKLLSCLTIIATIGYLVGTVMNIIVKDFPYGWRISLSVQFLVGLVLAVGAIFFLPRSPRWLIKKQRDAQALKVLDKVYMDEAKSQEQLIEIRSAASFNKEPPLKTLIFVFRWKNFQRLLLGFSLLLFGRFVGGTFLIYFSVSIFCSIGLPGFTVTLAVAITLLLAMFLSLGIIDKLGRKSLYLIGLSIMFVTHILSASLVYGFDLEDVLDDLSTSQTVASYVILFSVCLFLGAATISSGNVPFIIMGEFFPLRVRGLLVSISNTGFWIGTISVGQIGPIMITSLGVSGALLVFLVIIFLNILFVLLLLPETKGRTLEQIEDLFSKPWLERTGVLYYLRCGCFSEVIFRKPEARTVIHNISEIEDSKS